MTTIDTAALRQMAEHGFTPNPATILALLDALDAVTAERDQLREAAQALVLVCRSRLSTVGYHHVELQADILARLLEGEQQ